MLALASSLAPFWSRLEMVRPTAPARDRDGERRTKTEPVASKRERPKPARSLVSLGLVACKYERAPVRVTRGDTARSRAPARKTAPREKYPAVANPRTRPFPAWTLTGRAQLTRERPSVVSDTEASLKTSSTGPAASPTRW